MRFASIAVALALTCAPTNAAIIAEGDVTSYSGPDRTVMFRTSIQSGVEQIVTITLDKPVAFLSGYYEIWYDWQTDGCAIDPRGPDCAANREYQLFDVVPVSAGVWNVVIIPKTVGPRPQGDITAVGSVGGNFEIFLNEETIGNLPIHYVIETDAAAAVPEPATWTMLAAGFGAIGGAMRHRRRLSPSRHLG